MGAPGCYLRTVGRPSAKADPAEREGLRALIVTYQGNLSQMANALGNIDRQALSRKLKLLGIDKVAAKARAKANVSGPRSVEAPQNQGKLLALIAEHGYRTAADKLGISSRTMVRRMRAAGITGEMIETARAAPVSPGI